MEPMNEFSGQAFKAIFIWALITHSSGAGLDVVALEPIVLGPW